MGIDVSITLQDLQCITQDRGSNGSAPYIWPAMAWINTTTGNVIVVAPGGSSLARVVLSNGMKSGDTASIPSTIGSSPAVSTTTSPITRPFSSLFYGKSETSPTTPSLPGITSFPARCRTQSWPISAAWQRPTQGMPSTR